MTCRIIFMRSRHLWINSLVWFFWVTFAIDFLNLCQFFLLKKNHSLGGIREKWRYCHDFDWKFVTVIWTLDHHLGDHAIRELAIEYVRARLMHVMLKRKENEPQSDDVAMILYRSKGANPYSRKDVKMCYYCNKACHIVHFWYKTNNNN